MIATDFTVGQIPLELRDMQDMTVMAVLVTSQKIANEIVNRRQTDTDHKGTVFCSIIINIACGAVVTAVEIEDEVKFNFVVETFSETLRLLLAKKRKEFKQ